MATDESFPTLPLPIYSYGLMVGNTKIDSAEFVRWQKYKGEIRRVEIHNHVLPERSLQGW